QINGSTGKSRRTMVPDGRVPRKPTVGITARHGPFYANCTRWPVIAGAAWGGRETRWINRRHGVVATRVRRIVMEHWPRTTAILVSGPDIQSATVGIVCILRTAYDDLRLSVAVQVADGRRAKHGVVGPVGQIRRRRCSARTDRISGRTRA